MALRFGSLPSRITLSAGFALVIGAAALLAHPYYRIHQALKRAQALTTKGYDHLAEDILEPHRHQVAAREEGCELLLNIYYKTRNLRRLAWAAQSCLESGKSLPTAYLGLAAAAMSEGRDVEALAHLQEGAGKFPQSAEFPYRMSEIFRRNKQVDQAVATLLRAVEVAPDNRQVMLEALQFFSAIGRWSDARTIGDRLKSVPSDNPELKLLIARALQHGGDMGSARVLVDEAKKLLQGKSALEKALKESYKDVFKAAS